MFLNPRKNTFTYVLGQPYETRRTSSQVPSTLQETKAQKASVSQPCFHHTLVTEPEPGNPALGRGVLFPSAPSQESPPSVEVEDTAGQQGKCFVTLQQLGSPRGGTPATSQELNAIRVYTFQSPVISLSPCHSLRRTQAAGKGRSSSQEHAQAPFAVVSSFLFHF